MSTDTIELAPSRRTQRQIYSTAIRNTHTEPTSQQMAHAISTYGRDVFCVLDDALICLSLSKNWEQVSGFASADELGDTFKQRIAPDHVRKLLQYLTSGHAQTGIHFQIKHKNGSWRWCEMQKVDTDGAAQNQHTCILRDVTDLVHAEGKLEKAKLEAELAIKSRSEFLANMSHELRTPLNAILGFAQLMESGIHGEMGHPKYHDYIDTIQQSGGTLLSKINDLLEIANIDSGRMELRESPTDVGELIRHAIEFHSHRAFCQQITLRERLPKQPLLVNVDRIRMLQVLTNLLSNAIKYNATGGLVEITCISRKDGGINIAIEDNGGGIQAGHLENILEAFNQDNSFFARSRDCVGLGLALSKEIVKLHQGRIAIESEPGKGTLLTIRLPKERTLKTAPIKMMEDLDISAVN